MKSRNFPLLILCCLFFFQVGIAQQITVNENGEKIIVYPDGRWEYAKDTDTPTNPPRSVSEVSPENEVDKDLELAVQIADMAAAAEAEAIRQEENAKYERLVIEDDLKEAEGSDEYFEGELKTMRTQLKAAKKAEKKAKSARKAAAKKAKAAAELITMDPVRRAKSLEKYREKESPIVRTEAKEEEVVGMFPGGSIEEEKAPAPVVHTPMPPTRTVTPPSSRVKKTLVKYDPSKDVLFNPPREGCQLSFDGRDEFSGKKRKDVQKQLFFTYTNEELRSVFKDKDYITCNGYLSSLSGGLKFLTLNITIASKTAQREYGILEKGGQINIKLIDGENVKLVNTKTNMGTENPLEGSVSYRAQYVVSSSDEKKLKKSEVDKVRIVWSSGYEDYEIYELDFFIDQFKCLDK